MNRKPKVPLVAICCCLREIGSGTAHTVRERYIEGLLEGAGVAPVLLPAIGEGAHVETWLERIEGLVLTGSPSNVEPFHYGGGEPLDRHLRDPARDSTTLPLIRAAVARGLPLLGICRGIQELNVALGGSLHQRVHEVPGRIDHRSNKTVPADERYLDAHLVSLRPGGLLERITGLTGRVAVNSLHAQAIDRLAEPLVIEAQADDGTIEAVSLSQPKGFVLAVQWHPEYQVRSHPFNLALFEAFGNACRGAAVHRD